MFFPFCKVAVQASEWHSVCPPDDEAQWPIVKVDGKQLANEDNGRAFHIIH